MLQDGLLVEAMNNGDFFSVDEISSADDSVLKRLNSLLEPERISTPWLSGVVDPMLILWKRMPFLSSSISIFKEVFASGQVFQRRMLESRRRAACPFFWSN